MILTLLSLTNTHRTPETQTKPQWFPLSACVPTYKFNWGKVTVLVTTSTKSKESVKKRQGLTLERIEPGHGFVTDPDKYKPRFCLSTAHTIILTGNGWEYQEMFLEQSCFKIRQDDLTNSVELPNTITSPLHDSITLEGEEKGSKC